MKSMSKTVAVMLGALVLGVSGMPAYALAEEKEPAIVIQGLNGTKAELPQEVWNAINSGLTPRMALVEYKQKEFSGKMTEKDGIIAEKDQKIAALEQEIKTLKLNAENKKKAVGSLTSTAESDDRTGFLGGLFD